MINKFPKLNWLELLGWIGSLMLAFCGLPAAIEAYITKDCLVPWSLIFPWYLGEIAVFCYAAMKFGRTPLLLNYLVNILLISVMIYFKN